MKKLCNSRAKQLYQSYMYALANHGNRKLCNVYKKCSQEKSDAETKILNEMTNKNGFDYTIIGRATYDFSCGYKYIIINYDEPFADEIHLVYHTKDNSYDINITPFVEEDFMYYDENADIECFNYYMNNQRYDTILDCVTELYHRYY